VNLAINIDEDRQFVVNRINFTGNTTTRDEVIGAKSWLKKVRCSIIHFGTSPSRGLISQTTRTPRTRTR
jgi:hypothetical protein